MTEPPGDASPADPADPVATGIEHLQRAATEALAAARALLDAAEKVVNDPAALQAVVSTMTAVARSATETVAGLAAGRDLGASPDGDDDDGDGFERINVG